MPEEPEKVAGNFLAQIEWVCFHDEQCTRFLFELATEILLETP